MLIEKEIKDFQEIHKKVKGADISYKDAEESGGKLVKFFKLFLEIDSRNKNKT